MKLKYYIYENLIQPPATRSSPKKSEKSTHETVDRKSD